MSKVPNRSASYPQKGFLYQDIVMLHYFLRYLYKIKDIYAEDPEDITVHNKYGVNYYVQVKYVENVNSHYRSKQLKEAITTLFEDLTSHSPRDVHYLIYVTNSHYPFAKQIDLRLKDSLQAFYEYKKLPNNAKEKIHNQAKKVSRNENNKNKSLLKLFYKRFSLLMYSFEGSNEKTLFRALYDDFEYFVSQTNLDSMFETDLIGIWLLMIKEADCGIKKIGYGKKKNGLYPKKISKEDFVAHTSVPIMLRNGKETIKEFIQDLDLDRSYGIYLKTVANKFKKHFIAKFPVRSMIEAKFTTFKYNYYLHHKRQFEDDKSIKLSFLNTKSIIRSLSRKLFNNPSSKHHFIITQYLSWIVLTENNLIQGVVNFAKRKK